MGAAVRGFLVVSPLTVACGGSGDGAGSPPGGVCYQIDCVPTVRIDFSTPLVAPGDYHAEVNVGGLIATCDTAVPLPTGPRCSDALTFYRTVTDPTGGVAVAQDADPLLALTLKGSAPAELHVRVARDGTTIVDVAVHPTCEFVPLGDPGCPKCPRCTATLDTN